MLLALLAESCKLRFRRFFKPVRLAVDFVQFVLQRGRQVVLRLPNLADCFMQRVNALHDHVFNIIESLGHVFAERQQLPVRFVSQLLDTNSNTSDEPRATSQRA